MWYDVRFMIYTLYTIYKKTKKAPQVWICPSSIQRPTCVCPCSIKHPIPISNPTSTHPPRASECTLKTPLALPPRSRWPDTDYSNNPPPRSSARDYCSTPTSPSYYPSDRKPASRPARSAREPDPARKTPTPTSCTRWSSPRRRYSGSPSRPARRRRSCADRCRGRCRSPGRVRGWARRRSTCSARSGRRIWRGRRFRSRRRR